jgi:hypothetical protein
MDKHTLRALQGSIEKWEAIVAGAGKDEGMENCPLCQRFCSDDLSVSDGACGGCPVMEKTGKRLCWDTPYGEYSIGATRGTVEAAQAELDFLRSLLPAEAVSAV